MLIVIREKNVWLLSAAQAIYLACAVTATSIVGILGFQLAPDKSFVTLPNALLTIGVATTTVPISYFMKHYSRKYGFLMGSGVGFFGFLFGYLAIVNESFALLCLSSFLVGVYQATVMYYRFAATEYVSDNKRAIVISMVLVGSLIGALIAPFAVTAAEGILGYESYRAAYVYMMVFAILSVFPLGSLKRLYKRERLGEVSVVPSERTLMQILKTPKAVCALGANVSAWASMALLMAAAPVSMKQDGFSFQHSVYVIQWHVIGMYLPSLFSGYLITRFGIGKILMAGALALVFAVIAGLDGRTFEHYAVALIFVGLAWNLLFVSGSALLLEVHNDAEGAKVQGVNEFLGFIVGTIAAFSSGAVLTHFGWDSLLGIEIMILIFVLFISIWYLRIESNQSAIEKGL